MMVLCSVFRNAAMYIDRYVQQVKALREYDTVKVVVAEGDSEDDTYARLCATDFTVLKVEHGGPFFGSSNDNLRWRQLGAVCNVAYVAAVREAGNDPVVYIEGDLIWEPHTLHALVHNLRTVPAVAPMSFHWNDPALFYDVWGYVKDGTPFTRYPPYHAELDHQKLTPIDSAGSCFAIRPEVAQYTEFSLTDCIRGIGRSLRALDEQLWLDPGLATYHP